MRRIRKDATKVWHNPEITSLPRASTASRGAAAPSDSSSKKHRAALEALFAPKREPEEAEAKGNGKTREGAKSPGRIVLTPPPNPDERAAERQKLLSKLLIAEGRPKISKAADDFIKAGFNFPEEQDVHLQLLEHSDEEKVRGSIDALAQLLAGERPLRRTVLEARLRRLEEFAEEATTRAAATRLRRQVTGRGEMPSAPGSAQ